MSSTRSRQWASMWWVCLVALCLAAPIPLAVADHILESEDIIVHVHGDDSNGVRIENLIWVSERALSDPEPTGLVKARAASFPSIKHQLLERQRALGADRDARNEESDLERKSTSQAQGSLDLVELASRGRLGLLVRIDRIVPGVYHGWNTEPRPSPLVYLTIEEVLFDRGGVSSFNDEPILVGRVLRVVGEYRGCVELSGIPVCEEEADRDPAPELGKQYVVFGFRHPLGPGFLQIPWAAVVEGGMVVPPRSAEHMEPMTLNEVRTALRDGE